MLKQPQSSLLFAIPISPPQGSEWYPEAKSIPSVQPPITPQRYTNSVPTPPQQYTEYVSTSSVRSQVTYQDKHRSEYSQQRFMFGISTQPPSPPYVAPNMNRHKIKNRSNYNK